MAHADDHDLAQPPGKRRLPPYRVGVIEPAFGERGRVEQHAVDIDQFPAPAGAEFFDHVGKFGMVLLLDQGDASHGLPFVWAGFDRAIVLATPYKDVDARHKRSLPGRPEAEPGGASRSLVGRSLHLEAGRLHDRRPARKLLADELPRRIGARVEDRLEP